MYSKRILVRAEPFCGTGLISFHVYYAEHICAYLSFTGSVIGSTLNIFNIIVFTRKSMISPNNVIFANLAIVDLACMVAYLPRKYHEFVRLRMYSVKDHRVYEWETASLYAWHIASIFHGISIWFTIMLAVWRYIAIAYPLREREWCSMKNTKIFLAAGYLAFPLIWIPAYFDFRVGQIETLLDGDGFLTENKTTGIPTIIYKMQSSKLNTLPRLLTMILYGIVMKIVPTVVLSVYSYKLIVALLRAKKRRKELTARMYESKSTNIKQKQSADRTTKMLLVVLVLFFISEMPHGICCILTIIFGIKFQAGCYAYLFEIFNTVTLFCTSANFIIYYIMSQQFRNTFNQLFSCKSTPVQQKPVFTLPAEAHQVPYDVSNRSSITTLNSTRSSSITTIFSSDII